MRERGEIGWSLECGLVEQTRRRAWRRGSRISRGRGVEGLVEDMVTRQRGRYRLLQVVLLCPSRTRLQVAGARCCCSSSRADGRSRSGCRQGEGAAGHGGRAPGGGTGTRAAEHGPAGIRVRCRVSLRVTPMSCRVCDRMSAATRRKCVETWRAAPAHLYNASICRPSSLAARPPVL